MGNFSEQLWGDSRERDQADGAGTWTIGQSFVVHDSTERNLTLAHTSPNFERSGLAADIDVVYPIDRLGELAASGRIGSRWE